MKKRTVQFSRTTVVLFACLAAATPAWAGYGGYERQPLGVYLQGVNRYGCLSYNGGKYATFCALINTYSGEFCGCTRGQVCNESRRFQCYKNVNLFNDYYYPSYENGENGENGYDYYYVSVRCSWYSVAPWGSAFYVACGTLYNDD